MQHPFRAEAFHLDKNRMSWRGSKQPLTKWFFGTHGNTFINFPSPHPPLERLIQPSDINPLHRGFRLAGIGIKPDRTDPNHGPTHDQNTYLRY